MKITNLILTLPILLQMAIPANAAGTNELYLTDNNQNIVYFGSTIQEHHNELVAAATNTLTKIYEPLGRGVIYVTNNPRESLPAKDFPEGNWGEPFNGFQLSLRFAKQTYTNGEPITAIILVRNVTNMNMVYSRNQYGNVDGPIGFIITNNTGQRLVPQKPSFPLTGGGGDFFNLAQQTQRKHLEHLNKYYTLTNGTYVVRGLLRIAVLNTNISETKPDRYNWFETTSASVEIKIVDPPPRKWWFN